MVLQRPLETQKGVPCGRVGMAEGGRTAPGRLVENTNRLLSFSVCWFFSCYTRLTWAEDRATVGTDPSADPGAKTGDGGGGVRPPSRYSCLSGIGAMR